MGGNAEWEYQAEGDKGEGKGGMEETIQEIRSIVSRHKMDRGRLRIV